ncbi:unnamed protein product [Linum trigynum]|uniref:Uncharacterized protein n=1 Tax=Linum trigynum TaxID=586398 RepID=A0AAV2CVX7_9ROSI
MARYQGVGDEGMRGLAAPASYQGVGNLELRGRNCCRGAKASRAGGGAGSGTMARCGGEKKRKGRSGVAGGSGSVLSLVAAAGKGEEAGRCGGSVVGEGRGESMDGVGWRRPRSMDGGGDE